MGTMVCFLANASINPQTGSGNLAAGEWSEAYQTTETLACSAKQGFSLLATAAGLEPATLSFEGCALSG
jgi:hypothetical protein